MAFAQRVQLNTPGERRPQPRRHDYARLFDAKWIGDKSLEATSKPRAARRKLCIGMFVFYCALLLSVCIVALANSNAGRTRLGSLSAFQVVASSRTDWKARAAPTMPASAARRPIAVRLRFSPVVQQPAADLRRMRA